MICIDEFSFMFYCKCGARNSLFDNPQHLVVRSLENRGVLFYSDLDGDLKYGIEFVRVDGDV